MANLIGAGPLSDAFFVAFKLPNFFRRLFAEGAFNASFVPSFSSILTADGQKKAVEFAAEVMSVLLVALLILNAIFIIFMPWIMPLFAPGFADTPEKFDLTVALSQITFPYILFISLVSLLAGILNSLGKFAAPAAAPILLNLCMIGGMVFLTDSSETPAHALAFGVFIAGVVQFAWLAFMCFKNGCMPGLVLPRITPQVRTMLLLMGPAALGSGVQQLNLLVDVIIASHIPDAVSYLYYADRMTELPIGLIGVAVGTVLLPMLSKYIKAGEHEKAREQMNRALELVLLFGLPATAGLLVTAEPIIRVLYLHGAFTLTDMTNTASALVAFAAGLPAFLMVKVLAPGFYAHHDTKTPFKIALICVGVNLFFNLTLIHPFKHVGMAMATSIASWVNVFLMVYILKSRGMFAPDTLLKSRVVNMLCAATIMAGVILIAKHFVGHLFLEDLLIRAITLAVVIGGAAALYGAVTLFSGTYDLADLKKLLTRNRPA